MEKTFSFFARSLEKDFSGFCNEKLQELGLSKGLLYFILYIGKHRDCSPGDLSQNLKFDTGHTTRSIDKLVNMGFVLRQKSDFDKRAYLLQLTDKGQAAFLASHDLFSQWDEKILEKISQEERVQLMTLLEKLVSMKGDQLYV